MLIGIVGKPNCGKSTFFKASTLAEVEIANYPFATIKPNHGTGYVRVDCADKFFNTKCNPRFGFCLNHIRFVPVDLLDVAGLVPEAHKGKGLGLEFLNDLNQGDALIHVIDVSGSTNEKGEPVKPLSYDPVNDIRFLETELDMWYLQILKKVWDKYARQQNQENTPVEKDLAKQFSGLGADDDIIKKVLGELNLNNKKPIAWSEQELLDFASLLRKKTKPMVIAANKADIPGADKNIKRIQKEFPDYKIIPCSAESELALREAAKHNLIDYVPGSSTFKILNPDKLSDKQKKALGFIQENVLKKFKTTGLQDILDFVLFDLLKFIAIFPGGVNKLADQDGNILPDCFLLPPNSTALDFAFKLHTDFGNNFIKAIDVKTKKAVGKDHLLKHGDVVEIVSKK